MRISRASGRPVQSGRVTVNWMMKTRCVADNVLGKLRSQGSNSSYAWNRHPPFPTIHRDARNGNAGRANINTRNGSRLALINE
jgi:hypothetical protein